MAKSHKYKSLESNTKSWEEIEHFYNDLISQGWPLEDIIPLIQYIKNHGSLNQKLFACTSLDKLIVSVYNPIQLNREALHIYYEKGEKLWNFRYYSSPYREAEHERNYPGELLVEKFENYIGMLKW